MANYNLTQTGAQVQALLDTVAAGYIYMGVADLTTTPDTTNPNVCYLLKAVGTYTNFGNVTHSSGIGIALWNGTVWSYQNVPSSAVVATDATPTEGSTSPVQSGGTYNAIMNGIGSQVFAYSVFDKTTSTVTGQSIGLSQVGDYIETKAKVTTASGNILWDTTASYNYPRIGYGSGATTLYIRVSSSSTGLISYTNAAVKRGEVQIIKVALTSIEDGTYTYTAYLDGNSVGTCTRNAAVTYDKIGKETTMDLYYIENKSAGVVTRYEEFAKLTGATDVTDQYTSSESIGLIGLNEAVEELQANVARMSPSNIYYKFIKNSSKWATYSNFYVYQRLGGNVYLCTLIGYWYNPNNNAVPQWYWRMQNTNIVTLEDGEETIILENVLTPGENEFVLEWREDGYNYDSGAGATGGYHYGETIDDTGCYVNFIADGNIIDLSEDIPLTPCNEFYYKEVSSIYQHHDDTIACYHYKETHLKDGGYETFNSVKMTQAIDWFAYFGIVCVNRNISAYAMPEGVNTATDMGTGTPTQAEQFKSHNHLIHYEGNGFGCDVESRIIYGDDDSAVWCVVYNSTSYNKYYRGTTEITGSTLNKAAAVTKVKFYPIHSS